MDYFSRLKQKEFELLHGKNKTIFECAEHVGKSANYLYRISSPTEDLNFPLEIAIPLMKFTKNFDLLKEISHECGFVAVKVPTGKISKNDEHKLSADYQKSCAAAQSALIDVFENPCRETYKQFKEAIKNVIHSSATVEKTVDRKIAHQIEMEF